MKIYEQELKRSFPKVLREAEALYEGTGRLHKTYQRLTSRLQDLDISSELVGGYALILHGVRRFTEDIDMVIRPRDLAVLRDGLIGAGYVSIPGAARSIRDAQTGVRIDFVLSGEFPGDGKPKAVAFPDPDEHTEVLNPPSPRRPAAGHGAKRPWLRRVPLRHSAPKVRGKELHKIKVVDLKTLIELKLASGMTARNCLQDLADVQRLIEVHHLDKKFVAQLHRYVRPKFLELLESVRPDSDLSQKAKPSRGRDRPTPPS